MSSNHRQGQLGRHRDQSWFEMATKMDSFDDYLERNPICKPELVTEHPPGARVLPMMIEHEGLYQFKCGQGIVYLEAWQLQLRTEQRSAVKRPPRKHCQQVVYLSAPKETRAIPKLNGRFNQVVSKALTIREQIIADMKNEFQTITHIEEVGRGAARNRKYEGTLQVDGLPGNHNLMRIAIWRPEDVDAITVAGYEFRTGDVAIAVTIKNDPRNFWRIDDVLSPELLESEEVA